MDKKDKTNAWTKVLLGVQKRIDANTFETWFEPTSYIGQEMDVL